MTHVKALDNAIGPGSPQAGEPGLYLVVGTLRRPHGIRGDLLFEIETNFPERLAPGTFVFCGEKKIRLKITRRRDNNKSLILGFAGISNPEQASKYSNKVLYVSAEDRPPLPDGEYYHHTILGLTVQDETGTQLGIIREIIETGANDVYVVSPDSPAKNKEILIPALKEVILEVNLEKQFMRVHLLPGLLDEPEKDE